jgi:twitching motility protein PilT
MPFIDLSSPTNTATNVSAGNDLSGLPQNTMQNSMVAAPTVSDNVQVQGLPQQFVVQQPTPQQPVAVQENLPVNPEPVVLSNVQGLPNNEEHILMRNVPQDLGTNPTSVSDGVKEFVGPSLSPSENNQPVTTQNTPISVTANELPVINTAPVSSPVVQTSSIPVEAKVLPPVTPVVEKISIPNSDTPVAMIDQYLELVIQKKASDLHIAVGFPPVLRLDGKLVGVGNHDLSEDEAKNLMMPMLDKRLQDELLRNLDVDFSYTHKSGNRFRVNIFWSKGTLAGAFRCISSTIRSIADLNLPSICYDLIKRPHGLILFAGPTGSGKSTSIAAMIQEINLTEPKHIVTIEDPVEYIFPRAKSIVNQREVGTDTSGWKRALRELLRQDPNVVLVGEMRDFETIAATVTVAETGHLVFATLHTNSASQTIDRIIDVFPDAQQSQIRTQLATVISAVISQRLIPLSNGGRKAVFEVMIATPAIKNAIREGKTYQIDNIIQTSIDQGMIPLEKSLLQLIRNGEISIEAAKEFTTKPDELDSLLRGN